MFSDKVADPVKQAALAALTSALEAQGHPSEYAPFMATAIIFQADLDLRNAQVSRLAAWLKQEHPEVYPDALSLIEATREEFEKRVRMG
jgi:hypothetical protein